MHPDVRSLVVLGPVAEQTLQLLQRALVLVAFLLVLQLEPPPATAGGKVMAEMQDVCVSLDGASIHDFRSPIQPAVHL